MLASPLPCPMPPQPPMPDVASNPQRPWLPYPMSLSPFHVNGFPPLPCPRSPHFRYVEGRTPPCHTQGHFHSYTPPPDTSRVASFSSCHVQGRHSLALSKVAPPAIPKIPPHATPNATLPPPLPCLLEGVPPPLPRPSSTYLRHVQRRPPACHVHVHFSPAW